VATNVAGSMLRALIYGGLLFLAFHWGFVSGTRNEENHFIEACQRVITEQVNAQP